MAGLISSSIPNLVNGVSQQPYTLRLSSQGEVQENGLSTAAVGLKKRPPTVHLNKQALSGRDVFIHTIARDQNERYVVVVQNADLQVYDLKGNRKTVNFPSGKSYLVAAGGSAGSQFSACSVADYTFIVNKGVSVQQHPSVAPSRPKECLINVKQGNYGKTYSILINGAQVAAHTTPNGDNANQAPLIATEYIAGQLIAQLQTNGYASSPWSLGLNGSLIYLQRYDGGDFTVDTTDGFNNNALTSFKGTVARFNDLPAAAWVDGFTMKVSGDNTADSDDYWVKFVASGAGKTGVWKEVIAPGTSYGLVNESMPWTLVREADGTFTFRPMEWSTRITGDMGTNANPSFVGRKINSIFFYRDRLGLLSDESIILSESGSYFNFFRTSVLNILDSDPIDVSSTHSKVSVLRHALQFNKQLLLFSDQSQFVIDEAGMLAPQTVAVKLASEFPSSTRTAPATSGTNVYFPVDKGDWSAIREYYVDTNSLQNNATDITGHVPKYVPSGIVKLCASPNEDMLIALAGQDRQSLYVYKYYFSNGEKLQAAWSKWTFHPGDFILGVEALDSYLYLFVARGAELFFECIDLAATSSADSEPFDVYLDRKVMIPRSALVFDGVNTVIPMTAAGYSLAGTGDYAAVVSNVNPSENPGVVLECTIDPATGNAKVRGDLRNNDLIFGRKYLFRYVLSTITVKQQQPSGGQKSDTEGRLQLRKIAFNYAETGLFDVTVTPAGRISYNYRFTGKTLGVSARVGRVSLPTGRFVVPVMSQNTGVRIELSSDSPMPCSFLSADWEGFYVKRSQPV